MILRPALLTPAGAVAGALVVTSLLFIALGVDPLFAYGGILEGALGSGQAISDTLSKFVPIALIALGVGLTFRCGLWNAGGEGQFYAGAIGAALAGILVDGPPVVLILLSIGAGIGAGCLAALLPALLKARLDTNEILATLMFNFVPVLLAAFVLAGPLAKGTTSSTIDIHAAAQLPWFLGAGIRIHAGLLCVLAVTTGVYVLVRSTTFGYKMRAIGSNVRAAEGAGINVRRTQFTAFLAAGGLGGMAGAIQVMAISHNLVQGLSAGFGFTAIVAALLGRLRAEGILLAAFWFAALVVGADAMQRTARIPNSMAFVIEGLILFFLLIGRLIGRESVEMR